MPTSFSPSAETVGYGREANVHRRVCVREDGVVKFHQREPVLQMLARVSNVTMLLCTCGPLFLSSFTHSSSVTFREEISW
jgi:hypothetical protein